jgi:hypothetical protein
MYDVQVKMVLERIKVTISMKGFHCMFNAKCGYQAINGFSDGDPLFSQRSVIFGAFQGNLLTNQIHYRERRQCLFGRAIVLIKAKTLQYFGKDKIPRPQSLQRLKCDPDNLSAA